jgi:hypothetical protein
MKKNQGTIRKIGFLLPENDSNDSNFGDESV